MTMFRYLSSEWHDAAAPIRERFATAHQTPEVPIVANVKVTGVPFEAGTADLHSLPGIPNVFEPGHVNDADVTVTVDYALARLIVLDEGTNLLQLGLDSGQIAVEGDVDKLRSYWRTHIGDASYVEMMEALRAITK
ncbi:MAG: hypothetical protein AB8G26_16520 [Ilumatobacter sp.]